MHSNNRKSSVSSERNPDTSLKGQWNLCIIFPVDPNESSEIAQNRGWVIDSFANMDGVTIRETHTAIIVVFLAEESKDLSNNLIFRIPQRMTTEDITKVGGQFLIRTNEEDWQELREGQRSNRHLVIAGDDKANRLEFDTHIKAWQGPRELGRDDRQTTWRATIAAPHLTILRMSFFGSGEVSFRATNAQIIKINPGDIRVRTGTIPPQLLLNEGKFPGFKEMHEWACKVLSDSRTFSHVFGRWPDKTTKLTPSPESSPTPIPAPSAITQRSPRPLPPCEPSSSPTPTPQPEIETAPTEGSNPLSSSMSTPTHSRHSERRGELFDSGEDSRGFDGHRGGRKRQNRR